MDAITKMAAAECTHSQNDCHSGRVPVSQMYRKTKQERLKGKTFDPKLKYKTKECLKL